MAATTAENGDDRFTHGLIYDITKVLEEHGYAPPQPGQDGDASARNRAYGSMTLHLFRLVRAFEGVCDEEA